MGWNWIFLLNLVSAAGIFYINLTHNNVPWWLTAIFCLNIVLLAVSALINDMKNMDRDEKIEQLEKELDES